MFELPWLLFVRLILLMVRFLAEGIDRAELYAFPNTGLVERTLNKAEIGLLCAFDRGDRIVSDWGKP